MGYLELRDRQRVEKKAAEILAARWLSSSVFDGVATRKIGGAERTSQDFLNSKDSFPEK
jgi:hypothetical protein